MKNTPIEPHGHACGCCSPIGQKLDKEKWLDVGFGSVDLIIKQPNGKVLYRSYIGGISESEDQVTKVKDLEEEYGAKMATAEITTLFFNAPLYDALYEYNTEDGEWYLIKQGMGFA
ncbi:hypothetical protein [Paenibacillus alkalitolerans]|uniref:hypothetical protein n=1 Tax=Paenibacillus alkalitolerans TaxID=2799335 RepID=UPI0018F5393B|nr:hypothetical protein [Paenibacillus alkalitolerans]